MTTKDKAEDTDVRALEDAAWSLKDLAAEFFSRSLSAPDRAAINGARRDVERIHDRLVAVRDKRKLSRQATAAAAEEPAQAELHIDGDLDMGPRLSGQETKPL